MHSALTWPIELGKVDRLPLTKYQTAYVDEDKGRKAHHTGLHVRGRVVLDMAVAGIGPRRRFPENQQHVVLDARIGVFLNPEW